MGDPYVDERLTLKLILEKYSVRVQPGFIWLRMGVSCRIF
jgi:hypothetical protein